MAEIRINGLKDNSPITFCSDIPEWKAELGEIEENVLIERRGK